MGRQQIHILGLKAIHCIYKSIYLYINTPLQCMWELTATSQPELQGHSQGGSDGEKGKYWELPNGKVSFSPVKYSGYMALISYSLINSLVLHRARQIQAQAGFGFASQNYLVYLDRNCLPGIRKLEVALQG